MNALSTPYRVAVPKPPPEPKKKLKKGRLKPYAMGMLPGFSIGSYFSQMLFYLVDDRFYHATLAIFFGLVSVIQLYFVNKMREPPEER